MPNLLVIAAVCVVPLSALADDNAPGLTPPAPADGDPCVHDGGWSKRRLAGRLAFGVAKGHVEFADEHEGSQFSFVARAQGRRGFGLELELGRLTLDDDRARMGGVALFKSFGARRLVPYAVAGVGGGRIDYADDGGEQGFKYAELGGGLMLRGRRVAIGVDIRSGARKLGELDPGTAPATMDTMAAVTTAPDDRDRYVRGRIMALVHF